MISLLDTHFGGQIKPAQQPGTNSSNKQPSPLLQASTGLILDLKRFIGSDKLKTKKHYNIKLHKTLTTGESI